MSETEVAPKLLLHFDDEADLAHRLATALGWPCAEIACHCFPDGELKLTLPPLLPTRTVLLRGLQQPNQKLVQLMLGAPASVPKVAKAS